MKKYRFFFLLFSALLLAVSCPQNDDDSSDTALTLAISPANGHEFPLGGGQVTLSASSDADIYYTAGTGEPDQVYTGPITVTRPVTIKAAAKKEGVADSETISASYTITTNTAMDFVDSMKIGWNLGNTFDGHRSGNPSETAWQNTETTQALMDGVAAQGFGAVRIPVTWLNKVGAAPDYTIDSAWLDRVAEVVEYVRVAGMKAIINLHHDGADSSRWLSVKTADLTGSKKEAMDAQFAAMWTQIAEKFKNTGDFLLFEGFNELHDGSWSDGDAAQHARVNELGQIFVNTVRAAGGENSSRYLLIHGWVTRPTVTVSSLVLPTDTTTGRLIVGIHFYDPYNFTGSATQTKWGDKGFPRNWANEANVRRIFDSVKNRFINDGIPIIIGEYGAVNQSGDAFAYRKYYMEYVTKYAHDCRFVSFYWDNAGFGFGREKFGLLNRSDGTPYDSSAEEILAVMMKAVNEDYPLASITPP